MNNITFFEQTDSISGAVTEYALIDHGNEQFTSMLKSTFEAQQAAQVEHLTEIPTPSEA